jgi:hypothetical protein
MSRSAKTVVDPDEARAKDLKPRELEDVFE